MNNSKENVGGVNASDNNAKSADHYDFTIGHGKLTHINEARLYKYSRANGLTLDDKSVNEVRGTVEALKSVGWKYHIVLNSGKDVLEVDRKDASIVACVLQLSAFQTAKGATQREEQQVQFNTKTSYNGNYLDINLWVGRSHVSPMNLPGFVSYKKWIVDNAGAPYPEYLKFLTKFVYQYAKSLFCAK